MINAKREGYLSALGFCRAFNLTLKDDLAKVLRTHHVVESEIVNNTLKPTFKAHEAEIKERIGSAICKTSHKGLIEHEGTSGHLGCDVAKGLERLILEVPEKIDRIECIEGKYGHAIERYNLNIEKHLGVLEEMSATLKKIQKSL
jgi:hypothetical protein